MELVWEQILAFYSKKDIFYPFISLISICFIFSLFKCIYQPFVFRRERRKFDRHIAESTELKLEEMKAIALKSESSPFKEIIKSIKDLLDNSKEMSVTDIKALIEEKLLSHENSVKNSITIILSIGLFFTLFGVFQGLNEAFTDAADKTSIGEAKNINLQAMMQSFSVSFISTFIAFLISMLINFFLLQFILTKSREKFQRSLVLYAKNVMVPVWAVPDVDKNLGQLVRSINKSAESFEIAGKSLERLSNKNAHDSTQVLEAVKMLQEFSEKMKEKCLLK